jgi:hypothetical protein
VKHDFIQFGEISYYHYSFDIFRSNIYLYRVDLRSVLSHNMSSKGSLRRTRAVYDRNATIWHSRDEQFFHDRKIQPLLQRGPHCVSTVLAMLTGNKPEDFQGQMNTQNPRTWSQVLQPYGMKLAYCPMDVRKLKFYMDELIAMDDLFTLSYYTCADSKDILGDPDSTGWITGSHILILHRDQILDPQTGTATSAREHYCNECHTKRIFRVVPSDYACGL